MCYVNTDASLLAIENRPLLCELLLDGQKNPNLIHLPDMAYWGEALTSAKDDTAVEATSVS